MALPESGLLTDSVSLPPAERRLHRAAALARHRRDAVDRVLELALVDLQELVVAERDDAGQ